MRGDTNKTKLGEVGGRKGRREFTMVRRSYTAPPWRARTTAKPCANYPRTDGHLQLKHGYLAAANYRQTNPTARCNNVHTDLSMSWAAQASPL